MNSRAHDTRIKGTEFSGFGKKRHGSVKSTANNELAKKAVIVKKATIKGRNNDPINDVRILGWTPSSFGKPVSQQLKGIYNGRSYEVKTKGLKQQENMTTYDRNFIQRPQKTLYHSGLDKIVRTTNKRAFEIGELLKQKKVMLPNTGTFAVNIDPTELTAQQEKQYRGGNVNLATIGMKESLFGNLQNYEGRNPKRSNTKSSLITPVTAKVASAGGVSVGTDSESPDYGGLSYTELSDADLDAFGLRGSKVMTVSTSGGGSGGGGSGGASGGVEETKSDETVAKLSTQIHCPDCERYYEEVKTFTRRATYNSHILKPVHKKAVEGNAKGYTNKEEKAQQDAYAKIAKAGLKKSSKK